MSQALTLASPAVERIARRTSKQHRLAARMLLVAGLAIVIGAALTYSLPWMIAAFVVNLGIRHMYRVSRESAAITAEIAAYAASQPQLTWIYERGTIRARLGDNELSDRWVFAAEPHRDEITALPPARLV